MGQQKRNKFNDFPQNNYDFEALEKQLLANDPSQTAKQIDESYREQALVLMAKYGFEETYVPGPSDDGFNFIKPIGGSDENRRGFDGWEAIKDYFEDIDKLAENYTQEQLQNRMNGDLSLIEYGIVTDAQIQLALDAKRKERGENTEEKTELPFPDMETPKGNEEYYKVFYAGEQNQAAEELQKEKGWNKAYLTIAQGITFDSVVVYRSVEDLPPNMQEYVRQQENREFKDLSKTEDPAPKEETHEERSGDNVKPKDELLQKLKDGIKQTLDSQRFADWCKKQGRLYYNNYSLNNAMLTYFQKPDASYVCGYEAWKSYGRQVKQGAVGIKILAPVFARDYSGKGSLFAAIKKNCSEQLKKDSAKEFAVYRMGQSNLTFIMYKNGLFDVKINDKAVMSHATPEATRRFIDQSVIGKVPMYYNAVTVFDISDTTDKVEFLWVDKNSCSKSEMVLDEKGEAITNKRGQVKIRNSEERIAKFSAKLNTVLDEKDTGKMQTLYEALQKIHTDKGIPVKESSKAIDETLAGGARGYFRHPDPEYPNGYIVIDEELSPTNKVAVLFHEAAHADLHGDISKLQKELGNDVEITRQMKEVQAEGVAYMTASVFGIETQHRSFDYIANWSDGRELKALESSLDVIYRESQKLLSQIEKELGSRGLDMALEPKNAMPLKEEDKAKIVSEYKEFALNNLRGNEELQKAAISELKQMDNEEVSAILKEQIALTKQIEEKLNALSQKAELLGNSQDCSEQLKLEQQMKCDKAQISALQHKIDDLSTERVSLVAEQTRQDKADMKTLFMTDPMKAMERLKQEIPSLNNLTANDLKYLSTSKVIAREYSRYLGCNNEKFANLALRQLANMKEVMSKNHTAVEVDSCEQWSDKPIFEKGTVAHPRAANKIITDAEKESRILKAQAASQGEYYPYTKCALTVYSITEGNQLSALHTRIDIGDGEQRSLTDHLSQICKNGTMQEVLDNFKNSVKERSEAKMLTPQREENETPDIDVPAQAEGDKLKKPAQEKHRGMEAWKGMINGNASKEAVPRNEAQKESENQYA